MKRLLTPALLLLIFITIIATSYRNEHDEPKDLLTLEQKLDKLLSDPISVLKAKQYIKYYQAKVDAKAPKHFWIDNKTLDYFVSLRSTDKTMDGVRIYLAEYDENVTAPTTGVSYPKDTRTIVLVATRADANRAHIDWYGGTGATAVTPYNYSEPCPPGPGCEPGATLGQ